MVVELSLFLFVVIRTLYILKSYEVALEEIEAYGQQPHFEGMPMPHDMNALMWYDL